MLSGPRALVSAWEASEYMLHEYLVCNDDSHRTANRWHVGAAAALALPPGVTEGSIAPQAAVSRAGPASGTALHKPSSPQELWLGIVRMALDREGGVEGVVRIGAPCAIG